MSLFNFEFFKRVGFYISLVSIASLIAGAVSYTLGFTENLLEYNASNVLSFSLIAVAAYFVMLIIEPLANYAPVVLFGGVFVSFLMYVNNIYMYFTGIFYNGVSAEAFALIDPIVMISMVCFVVALVASNVAFYFRHSAEEEE